MTMKPSNWKKNDDWLTVDKKENKPRQKPYILQKINTNLIVDLNIKYKNVKLLEGNTVWNLHCLGFDEEFLILK